MPLVGSPWLYGSVKCASRKPLRRKSAPSLKRRYASNGQRYPIVLRLSFSRCYFVFLGARFEFSCGQMLAWRGIRQVYYSSSSRSRTFRLRAATACIQLYFFSYWRQRRSQLPSIFDARAGSLMRLGFKPTHSPMSRYLRNRPPKRSLLLLSNFLLGFPNMNLR